MLTTVCGMEWRTYCVFIGRLDSVLSIVGIILSAVGLRCADVIGPQIAEFFNTDTRFAASDLTFILQISIFMHFWNVPASILVAVGIIKERFKYLAPWIGLNSTCLIMASMLNLMVWAKLLPSSVPILKVLAIILAGLAFLVIRSYLVYGVYSGLRRLMLEIEELPTLIATNAQPTGVKINRIYVRVEGEV